MKRRVLIFVSIAVIGVCGCRGRASLDTPARLSPAQIADRAKPATVAIVSTFEASGSVAELTLDTTKLGAVVEAKQGFFDTRQEVLEKAFGLFLDDPREYLREEGRREVKVTLHALGTGFIVTPDGYILTNAHVVDPDREELKKAVVEREFPGKTIGAEAMERLKETLGKLYARSAELRYSTEVSAAMPTPVAASEREVELRHCEIDKLGVPTPGKDVAVLKMEGGDLPTLPLAPALEPRGCGRGRTW